MPEATRKTISLRVPRQVADRLEMLAKLEGKSMNQTAIDAIEGQLEKLRADPDFQAKLRKAIDESREALELLAE